MSSKCWKKNKNTDQFLDNNELPNYTETVIPRKESNYIRADDEVPSNSSGPYLGSPKPSHKSTKRVKSKSKRKKSSSPLKIPDQPVAHFSFKDCLTKSSKPSKNGGKPVCPDFKRMKALAIPKCKFDRHLRVDPYHISRTALTYHSSKRIENLAIPKWEATAIENTPTKRRPKSADPSARLLKLAVPKDRMDLQTKPDPFMVQCSALSYTASARTRKMSCPKSAAPVNRTRGISPAALAAIASRRTAELAQPVQNFNTHSAESPFSVKPGALSYKASPRIEALSMPNLYYEKEPDGTPFVSEKALRAKASRRVQQLACPVQRRRPLPDRCTNCVSRRALSAHASSRIVELARPKSNRSILYLCV